MKVIRVILLLLLAGCTSSKIVYDYDSKADFNAFKTYNFYDDAGVGMNDIDVKRATQIIENVLNKKGFQKSDTPDFLINMISQKLDLEDNNQVGVGIGGGRNVGIGISGGISFGPKKIREEFTIEFVNSKNNQLFWEGTSNKKIKEKISPEEREVYLKEVIQKIVEGYPPKRK